MFPSGSCKSFRSPRQRTHTGLSMSIQLVETILKARCTPIRESWCGPWQSPIWKVRSKKSCDSEASCMIQNGPKICECVAHGPWHLTNRCWNNSQFHHKHCLLMSSSSFQTNNCLRRNEARFGCCQNPADCFSESFCKSTCVSKHGSQALVIVRSYMLVVGGKKLGHW